MVCFYVYGMQLNQASTGFLIGYYSTHERSKKTVEAYCSDLAQFRAFAGSEFRLMSLSGAIIEEWAADLRQES
jgi:site-specific recombinase XerD